MAKLFSYVLPYDDGAAPNPFWGTCTLTICKPKIRRVAEVGDWIIGTGSKNTVLKDGNVYDFSNMAIYIMRVDEKMTLKDYDTYCNRYLPNKLPKWFNRNFEERMGDCIYDYTNGDNPKLRKSVHTEENRNLDLGGGFALLSKHFYYFGEEPKVIPKQLSSIVKKGQGHKKIQDEFIIRDFEDWITKFKKNKIYAEPQLKYEFVTKSPKDYVTTCSVRHLEY